MQCTYSTAAQRLSFLFCIVLYSSLSLLMLTECLLAWLLKFAYAMSLLQDQQLFSTPLKRFSRKNELDVQLGFSPIGSRSTSRSTHESCDLEDNGECTVNFFSNYDETICPMSISDPSDQTLVLSNYDATSEMDDLKSTYNSTSSDGGRTSVTQRRDELSVIGNCWFHLAVRITVC